MQTANNTILITGGGSGIGRELAQRFNDLGNTVIVTGRRASLLQETIAGRQNMHAFELDIDDPKAINAFAQRIVTEYPSLNVLINNAGIMRYEDLSTRSDLCDAQAQITTNVLGPIRLTNAFIDHLKSQQNPAIVNVSSGLAFVPRADAAVYSATKAAVHFYTLSLRHQLVDQVEVIELVPPGIQTELTPGQSDREGYMPLNAYIDEVMALFCKQPTPNEIVVDRAQLQRLAEREGRFEQVFDLINVRATEQRARGK
ncbi:probable short chain dehydrogenase [Pectobacterium atrosepticum SCRI1043]|uniref:Probable short chain dehydrogenase n=1 Tax=Pectobacterium atrosepticum (strain SCRI 1043 / ATCC BAA-672) TaxID=218491 RepID=Q6D7W8_PECAS|nr:SDR family oxidoreductase [Pectobacterium atrosepticum]GKV86386.1 oxidoreductase [Pectobacterium carotovorum subsp. carotovorum]AIA70164.1 DltE [Pectobacterium atrosepticum]AIK13085.1 putative short chain dehydrogenase [Pectobacterium atrosepticum]ATY89998.1 oxidoreductase [Pectobacterium atrosepticum]KFX16910.1 DltE [Pectobacterium atrosepticum]